MSTADLVYSSTMTTLHLRLPALLLFGCTDPLAPGKAAQDSPPPVDSGPADDTGGTDPTEVALPGTWEDPILAGVALSLEVAHPELTDALLAGDQLVFVGQEQDTDGGMWTYSLADPDAPAFLGHTTNRKHIQRACWDGSQAWGMTREGMLVTLSLGSAGPTVLQESSVGQVGTGISCDASHVAWGAGVNGGGWAEREGTWIGPIHNLNMEVEDVRLEGDRLWVLARNRLTAMDIEGETLVELGHVDLDGACLDIAPGERWLAVACGSGGVTLVDRGDGQLGQWQAWASARAVSVQGSFVWVAAWTDLVLLDAADATAPVFAGAEQALSSVMSVAAGEDDRVYAADWNQPFVATRTGASAPEVRVSTEWVSAGGLATVYNHGTEALWIDGVSVAPNGSWAWEIAEDAVGTVSLATDDPDEPTVSVEVGGPAGLVVGAAAPGFSEPDLYGELWELSMLHGEVVFLALFSDG